jgi:sigma-B regulation protein RsbU (phosphoserine phosphatase)
MSAIFFVVISISAGLFYGQFISRYENEVHHVKTEFKERVLGIDSLMKEAINHVEAMQIAAQSSLIVNPNQSSSPSLLFSQLERDAPQNNYALDNVKAPFNTGIVGNLTGMGSLEQRSQDFYREIEMALRLNAQFQITLHNLPNVAWAYYLSSANQFINLYPWVVSQKFRFTEKLYTHEFYTLALPENNPQRQSFWTNAYIDEAGKGLMVTSAAPVYDGDEFLGIVALDFTLDFLNTFIQKFEHPYGVPFVINQNNQLLAHPTLVSSKDDTVKTVDMAFAEITHTQINKLFQAPPMKIQEIESHLFLYQNFQNVPWKLVLWVEKDKIVLNAMYSISLVFLVLFLSLAVIFIVTLYITLQEFIIPAERLVKHIESEYTGITSPIPKIPNNWFVWFQTVSEIFKENRHLVTSLKATNQGLHENEQKFRAIFEQTHQLVGITTTDGILLEVNKTALQLSCVQKEAVIGKLFWEAPWWNHSKALQIQLKTAIKEAANGKFIQFEAIHPNPVTGKMVFIDFSIRPLKDKSKNVIMLIPEGRDITERKQAEENKISLLQEQAAKEKAEMALLETEGWFRNIVETTPDWVWEMNQQAEYVYTSPQIETLLGFKPDEILGKTPFHLMPLEEAKRVNNIFADIVQKGKPFANLENTNLHKAGHEVIMETSGVPLFDLKGNLYGWRGIDRDVTERKRATQKLVKLNQSSQKFVPHQFLNLLGKKSVIDVQLGDQIAKEMTVLFADIRNFTSLSENMSPEDNFNFINAYLGQMEPVIAQHHGFIDKYIGDAIMALFPSADDALPAAIGMLKRLATYNLTRGRPGRPILNIGIGLNTGPLILGTVGTHNRMDSTVIADAVNLASRVEQLTKFYDTSLLITEYTYLKLVAPSQYHIRVIDGAKVKGKSEEITVYEVFDADQPESIALKNKTLSSFKQGFVLYHCGELADAQVFFENVLQENKNDNVARIYLQRCQLTSI